MSFNSQTPRQLSRLFACTKQQVRSYSAPGDRTIPPAKAKYVPASGHYPQGFLVGTAHVGVKASNTKYDDLALIVSERPCQAAAVFTRNAFKAAPVLFTKSILSRRGRSPRGVVINSGCANAVTGQGGLEDAKRMSEETSRLIADVCKAGEEGEEVKTMVMSTGVIGQRLPIEKIISKLPAAKDSLKSSHAAWLAAANAICTTDTFPKLISYEFTLPSRPDVPYCIAGMTKGAGMIAPNMATLLGVVCTDAPVFGHVLHQILQRAIKKSFNAITIDGDTSTNDTVAVFANGAAGGKVIQKMEDPLAAEFEAELTSFLIKLAQLVVRDGEGATKFVTIKLQNGTPLMNIKQIAKGIANSALVKTALYGKDANWGRIACAVGYSSLRTSTSTDNHVIPEETSISFIPSDGSDELKLLVNGEPQNVDEVRAKEILEMEDLEIVVKLRKKESGFSETMWTCDFSHEYVTINGDYRT